MPNPIQTKQKARPSAARITENRTTNKGRERSHGRLSKRRKKARKEQRQKLRAAICRQRQRARGLDEKALHKVSKSVFGGLLHHKQVLSLALVALGVIYTVRLTIHAVGTAMAQVRGHARPKHGIKQVDRYMSNAKVKPVVLREGLVRAVVGKRKRIEVTMDWTGHDKDDQTTLIISLLLRRRGRATPLVWVTEKKSELKDRQKESERTVLQKLRDALPKDVRVTVLADRGFGDTGTFDHLLDMPGFDFVIRFRSNIIVTADGQRAKAKELVPRNGRFRVLESAQLTAGKKGPYTVVLYKARGMKDSWCLATNLSTADGRDIVDRYARRFECEEGFRDLKDWRFGLALNYTRIGSDVRRERLLFAFALAVYLLTLVGAASEQLGMDRQLRANTSKRRTHSLFRQGREIVKGALPDVFEYQCFQLVRLMLAAALTKGFCHAIS